MMDIIFTVNEISIVYFKVNIENEKKIILEYFLQPPEVTQI